MISAAQEPLSITNTVSPATLYVNNNATPPNAFNAMVSQHRLMELSRFSLRGYDMAQQMLSQQGAVSKLLGMYYLKCSMQMNNPVHNG